MRGTPHVTYSIHMTTNETLKRTRRELAFWLPKFLPILTTAAFFFIAMPPGWENVEDPDATAPPSTSLAPVFEDYRAEAEDVCGGPVVKTSPKVKSATVVVVMVDASVAVVDTDTARSWLRADLPVWPIAVCSA